MKRIVIFLLLILIVLTSIACSKKKKITSIKIAYSDCSYDVSVANVISNILASQTKLKVELVELPEEEIVKALADGRADLTFSLWLPNTHSDYILPYKDSLEFISEYYNEIITGLAVPDYMPIVSIDQLNGLDKSITREIVICDTSSVISKSCKELINVYKLENYKLKAFEKEDELLSYVSSKIANTQPVIFSIYQPHWIFSSLKLKMLNDSRKVFGSPEHAVIYARKGFTEDLEQISGFLKQVKFTSLDINELMYSNETPKSDPKVIALSWIDKNADRINLWINKAIESQKK